MLISTLSPPPLKKSYVMLGYIRLNRKQVSLVERGINAKQGPRKVYTT